jgi:hypothetical protein
MRFEDGRTDDDQKGDASSQPENLFPEEEATVMSDANKVTPTKEEIRSRAYSIYEARGRRHGQDVDDWITAERELAQQSNRSAQKTRAAKAG